MAVATVTVVHHELESILSKQPGVPYFKLTKPEHKKAVATVTVVHHEQQSITSKTKDRSYYCNLGIKQTFIIQNGLLLL